MKRNLLVPRLLFFVGVGLLLGSGRFFDLLGYDMDVELVVEVEKLGLLIQLAGWTCIGASFEWFQGQVERIVRHLRSSGIERDLVSLAARADGQTTSAEIALLGKHPLTSVAGLLTELEERGLVSSAVDDRGAMVYTVPDLAPSVHQGAGAAPPVPVQPADGIGQKNAGLGAAARLLLLLLLLATSLSAQAPDLRSRLRVRQDGAVVSTKGVITLKRRPFEVGVWLDAWRAGRCLNEDHRYCPTILIRWLRSGECWEVAQKRAGGDPGCVTITGVRAFTDSSQVLGNVSEPSWHLIGESGWRKGSGTEDVSYLFSDRALLRTSESCVEMRVELFPYPPSDFPLCFLTPPEAGQ